MNIYVLYNEKNNDIEDIVQRIVKLNDDLINKGESKINFFYNLNTKRKINLYAIFSNNIEEILKLKKDIDIKEKDNILILTDNLESSHIIKCIELTPNVFYMKNEPQDIINKIIRILK